MGSDGDQEYEYTAYNLDVIISVGYRSDTVPVPTVTLKRFRPQSPPVIDSEIR